LSPNKSGLHYPNKFARILFLGAEKIVGKNSLNAVLKLAGLDMYIDNYPPDDMEKAVDFADLTALILALLQLYGPQGGRGTAVRVGRESVAAGFQQLLADYASIDTTLPLEAKMRAGLTALASFFGERSDQVSQIGEESKHHFMFTLERCPFCWQEQSDKPMCQVMQGIIQEFLHLLSDGAEFKVDITACIARGNEKGCLVIYK
jgi:predicted hydrocarbon binding protein